MGKGGKVTRREVSVEKLSLWEYGETFEKELAR